MSALVDALDALVGDAHRAKGWQWVASEPLWLSWPLEKFGTSGAFLNFGGLTSGAYFIRRHDSILITHDPTILPSGAPRARAARRRASRLQLFL